MLNKVFIILNILENQRVQKTGESGSELLPSFQFLKKTNEMKREEGRSMYCREETESVAGRKRGKKMKRETEIEGKKT